MGEDVNKNSALDVQIGGAHYKKMPIQPVEFVHKNGIGFCEGSAIAEITGRQKRSF